MCSTGLATIVLATPAIAPDAYSSAGGKSEVLGRIDHDDIDVPRFNSLPFAREPKNRLDHSNAPNWIDTHAPIPNNGVKVPCP
jgi:hypothetical protein